jgi:hypothetical protein
VANRGSRAGRARDALALALILAAATAAHRPFLGLGHLGWDTYPLILTSRIASPADLLGAFREELMDGRYPHGRFYRPLTTLSFGLDRACSGLDASGYHRTDLLLLLACTLLVAALARRLMGPGVGPLIAALLYALHPLHVETLPVAARRADTLAQLFTLLALIAAPAGRRREAWRSPRAALCALAAALAVLAKESGSLAAALVVALAFAEAAPAPAGERLGRALRAGALPLAAVALVLLGRSAVLGGMGGHPGSSLLAAPLRGLGLAPLYASLLLMPQPWLDDPTVARALALASGGAFAAALAALARDPARRPLLLVCAVWLLGGILLIGVSGEIASWYALALLPPFALLLGGLAQSAARWAGERRAGACAAAAGLTLLLLAEALRYTPLLHSYPEWTLVSERSERFLARVQAAAAGAAPGQSLEVPGLPLGVATPMNQVGVRSALGLAEYSVEAWAELVLPGQPIVVTRRSAAAGPPPRDAIRIETTPDPEAGRLP